VEGDADANNDGESERLHAHCGGCGGWGKCGEGVQRRGCAQLFVRDMPVDHRGLDIDWGGAVV
jgi:hypothetical protein